MSQVNQINIFFSQLHKNQTNQFLKDLIYFLQKKSILYLIATQYQYQLQKQNLNQTNPYIAIQIQFKKLQSQKYMKCIEAIIKKKSEKVIDNDQTITDQTHNNQNNKLIACNILQKKKNQGYYQLNEEEQIFSINLRKCELSALVDEAINHLNLQKMLKKIQANIDINKVTENQFKSIVKGIQKQKNLFELELFLYQSTQQFNLQEALQQFEALNQHGLYIFTLQISNGSNNLSQQPIPNFQTFFSKLSQLKYLEINLPCKEIDDYYIISISQGVSQLLNLEQIKLDISRNNITYSGITVFMDAFQNLSKIEEFNLNLNWNQQLGYHSAQYIIQSLFQFKKIKVLRLYIAQSGIQYNQWIVLAKQFLFLVYLDEFEIQTGYGLKHIQVIYERIAQIKLLIHMNTLFLKTYFKHIAPNLYPQLVNPIYNHWDLYY
ncbi:hypothetical protein TTHERM_00755810 (macronuclear) [Tetrahymena thermophila SB210]|uniref:Kinase domain protein n=1 Tax=Tetrahymena thermophila (strain SB210) TaxID=312017 RepID=I7LT12_TETTS|nr:hypothetical protein TTHERM_00755810 [Tetrahymena thermophila SB210]EAR84047.2 hypothetical protein TTHERM_00755810 [Tetrahymena thermophila SB210]|eukprot:XP_001031710.2 hypothetical protein TTHERM_00755810 [Tetrahymena thermophila SB210]